MTRQRLRPAHSERDLRRIYAQPHNHFEWEDHHARVDVTTAIAEWLIRDVENPIIADLSCGNAEIAHRVFDGGTLHLGDFAPGYTYHGPIEETIDQIPSVDLFICSETIEHLDDPDLVLRKIREKSRFIVLSTPIGETIDDGNEEHYWGWNQDDIHQLLKDTLWNPVIQNDLKFYESRFGYDFQIWGCE